ncbi:MAG: hemerythrin domain-containing protein [Thermodesulfobacteriota bacterium]
MSNPLFKIKYKCLHPSCQVYCKKGELTFDEEYFSDLSAEYDDESLFKSPPDYCRLGFMQPFKVISRVNVEPSQVLRGEESEVVAGDAELTDPMEILKAEHQGVLKRLDAIEVQLRKRDLDGLWRTTAAVENDIIRHSIMKEEQALFPAIVDLVPMGHSLVSIMHEDHKEFLSLLHALRAALQDGEVLDGIANSIIVNLRSHIRKEDGEFFGMIDEHIDGELRKDLMEKFAAIEKSYVPIEPGERAGGKLSSYSDLRRKIDAEVDAMRHNLINQESSCCEHA